MATYDVTAQVNELITLGVTAEEITTTVGRPYITMWGDGAEVRTRAAEDTVHRMLAAARAKTAPAPAAPIDLATAGQVRYITRLLAQRATSGEGGGFVSTRGLYRDGNIDEAAVRALTKSSASMLIDSLTNNY